MGGVVRSSKRLEHSEPAGKQGNDGGNRLNAGAEESAACWCLAHLSDFEHPAGREDCSQLSWAGMVWPRQGLATAYRAMTAAVPLAAL
jgi:hypothetical protein